MEATRREFLQAGSITILGALAPNGVPRRLQAMPLDDAQAAASRTAKDLGGVKALTFDTFGTVVDYRSTIIAEGFYSHQQVYGK